MGWLPIAEFFVIFTFFIAINAPPENDVIHQEENFPPSSGWCSSGLSGRVGSGRVRVGSGWEFQPEEEP